MNTKSAHICRPYASSDAAHPTTTTSSAINWQVSTTADPHSLASVMKDGVVLVQTIVSGPNQTGSDDR
jgi:hypothetical protein